MLAAVVIGLSLGPALLRDILSGLTFARPPAASIAMPPPHIDPELQRRLQTELGSLSRGRPGAFAVHLRSGAAASVDAERVLPAASLFKIPILVEVLAQLDAGGLAMDQRLEIRPEDWTDGSGVLQARVGERLSVRELIRLMIQESDNIAALVLLDAVGVDSVNATAQSLGLRATRLIDHRAGDSGEHTTSAADMGRLLLAMAAGQAVNERVSEDALRLLELRQTHSWLGDGLPFWVKVAHKWGDLPDVRNDVGVVYTPRGSYVLAVLIEGGQPDESAAAIARASRAAYDYLSQ